MSEREALNLVAQADKTAVTFGWFGGNKYEEASELYNRAANSFKLAKKWSEAGDAFCKAADMHINLNENDEAAADYINASKSFKKSNPQEAIRTLQRAIGILTDRGRFYMAAGHQKTVAEIYETDLANPEGAMQAYELAADWYSGEESTSQATACSLKAAQYAAQLEHYDKAIQKYEAAAANSVDNQLTKWSLKDYLLKAGLCWLCSGDFVGSQRAVERYCEMDAPFQSTRECQFLQALLEATESGDVELYTEKVFEFDKLMPLDNWKTTMLLRIKRSISEETSLT